VQDIWWNVKDLGYLTYYGSQLLAQCKITGKEGETFKAGRHASLSWWDTANARDLRQDPVRSPETTQEHRP